VPNIGQFLGVLGRVASAENPVKPWKPWFSLYSAHSIGEIKFEIVSGYPLRLGIIDI